MHLEGAKVRSYRRNAGERRVAIALLLAFAALVATANPVQAETELWSATLNIAEPDAESGPEGYCSVAWASAFLRPTWCPYGSLTGTDGGSFEFDGTTYTVEILRYDAGIRDDNSVRLVISPATLFSLHSRTQNWRLHIGSKTFSLSDAHRGTQVGADFTTVRHWWEVTDDDSGRPWPEPGTDSTVAVKLVDVSATTLSALTLKDASDGSAIAFTPSFTSDTEEYTATVAHGVDYVELAATTSDDQATVEYLGASGNAYYDRNGRTDALDSRLSIGSNTYRVKVTAEDNVTTKTYTLVVTRRDRLKGWFSGLPDSHDGSTPFTVDLGFPEAIDSPLANVSAAVAVENGTMSNFSARDGSARKYRMTVTPSSAGPLRIRVRAARDCSESHSICSTSGKQFAREMGRWVSTADDARLRALWLTYPAGGYLRGSPAFSPDTDAYEAEAPEPTERLVLVAAPYTPGATVTFGGSTVESTADRYDGGATATFRVADGTARVTATVTAPDGMTTRTYTYTVERNRVNPVDSVIRNLTVTPVSGTLTSFSKPWPQARTYFAEVSEETTHVTVSAAAVDPNAELTLHRNSPGLPEFSATDRLNVRNGTVTVVVKLNRFTHQQFYRLIITRDWRGLSMATAAEPLTASFVEPPSSHDGSTSFPLRVSFSEEVTISADDMRDHALSVSGGTVTGAAKVDGRSDLWELTVAPSGNGAVTILVPVNRACSEIGALCTRDGRVLSTAPVALVPGPPQGRRALSTPLTATFQSVPAEHDGSSNFQLRLLFSEALPPGGSGRRIARTLAATGGKVRRVRRVDGRRDLWRVVVKPLGNEAVTVSLPTTTGDCSGTDALCTPDGRKLSGALTVNIPGPSALSVTDAEVDEGTHGTDAPLEFVVTLSREASGTVTVDYATSDGTAVAPGDYTETSGRLTFEAGETEKTVSVPVHADAEDEGSETMMLTLSNPTGRAYLEDATATGTIHNTGHIPKAWIARFGRTVADQVLAAVDERLRASRSAGMSVVLGGEAIDLTAAATEPGAASAVGADGTAAAGSMPGGAADAGETARLKSLTDWLNGEDAEEESTQARSRSMTAQQVLMSSSFSLAGRTKDSGFAALWGRIAQSRFSGREGTLSLDGDVTTGLLGFDHVRDRWTTGLVVSRSTGTGGYRGESSGDIEADVTAVTPWAGYAASERLSVWGAAGYGAGELTVKPEEQAAMKTDLSMKLAAGGLRATLAGGDGPRLDAVAGARWVQTTSARLSSSEGNLAAATADMSRLTLGLEGSWPLALGPGGTAGGATATPRLALGLRLDGGDAETGYGVDLAGGIDLALPEHGLTASLSGRGLLTHEAAGLRDRGIAGTLAWTPRSPGRGPSLSLSQTFGAGASSGKDALLTRETLKGLAANEHGDEFEQRRLEARFGYGFATLGDRFTATPEIALGLWQAGRDYSLGWRMVDAGRGTGSLELSLEATRRESANDDAPPEHGIGFRLTARW